MKPMDRGLAKKILGSVDRYRPSAVWSQKGKGVYSLEIGLPSFNSSYCSLVATLYKRFKDRRDILPTYGDRALLYVNNVQVDPLLGGKGLAKSMMQAAATAGIESGADLMYGLVGVGESGVASRNKMIRINAGMAGKGGIEFHDGDFNGSQLAVTAEQAMAKKGQYCVLVDLREVDAGDGWSRPRYETKFLPT